MGEREKEETKNCDSNYDIIRNLAAIFLSSHTHSIASPLTNTNGHALNPDLEMRPSSPMPGSA